MLTNNKEGNSDQRLQHDAEVQFPSLVVYGERGGFNIIPEIPLRKSYRIQATP